MPDPGSSAKAGKKNTRKTQFEIKMEVDKDEYGKPIRKSFYSSKSKKAAREKGEKYRENLAIQKVLGGVHYEESPKFSEVSIRWLHIYKRGNVKDNTYYGTYENPVRVHLNPEFGDKKISAIKHTDIQIFMDKKAHDYTEESLKKMLNSLRAIFQMAVEDDIIRKNPAQGKFTFPKCKPSVKKRVWTRVQYDKFLEYLKPRPDALDIRVMAENAISRSEDLGLWPENLLDSKCLQIKQGTVSQKNSKTGKHELKSDGLKNKYRYRTIPISTDLYEALKNKPRTIVKTVDGQKVTITPQYLFFSPEGKQWDPDDWYKRKYIPFMEEMHAQNPDIPILNPHELRHTRVTLWKQEGVDTFYIVKMCGWKDSRMLDTRYGHFDPEDAREKLGLK